MLLDKLDELVECVLLRNLIYNKKLFSINSKVPYY